MGWLRRLTARSPQDRFAEEVAGTVRSLLGAKVRATPDFALEISEADGSTLTLNLHTLFASVQGVDAQEREGRIRTAVLAMVPEPRPRTWEEAAPRLLPAVRAVSWSAAMNQVPLVRRSLAPFVSLMCAIDAEYGMSFVTEDDLVTWGVPEEQVLARAAANLAEVALPVGVSGSRALILEPDGYASSWLVAPGPLRAVAADLGDDVVAVAPDRDHLLLVDTDDEAATVEVLRRALESYQEAPRQLSPVPYRVGEHGVSVWTPPEGHPARPLVDNAVRYLAAVEYGQQRTVLEGLFEKTGADVFVAACSLVERPDRTLWTYALWVRQVTDGLVPQADVVILDGGDASGDRVVVPWADALRIAGPALERTGYDPPLWRHRGWPDDATLAALREAALPPPVG